MKRIAYIVLAFNLFSSNLSLSQTISLNDESNNKLYQFAFNCIDQEYPNKPGSVLGNDSYLSPPRVIHPAFYGCFDWHSSVHGHWALVTILKEYPGFEKNNLILAKLKKNITPENILKEVEFLNDPNNKDFERTYGWAWLLKLDETLREWSSPEAIELHKNLFPLTELVSFRFKEFLLKLNYPIRVGEHSNLAFGLSFAFDYATKYDQELASIIINKAKQFYLKDCGCPISWEPGGFDFISPCLQEASLMMKVMNKEEFTLWLDRFIPGFKENPESFIKIAEVSDRSDGKLAHLDGLNFSRAWTLYEIGHKLNNSKMVDLADQHLLYSYTKLNTNEYAGSHWLASFALYALMKKAEN